MIVAADFVRSAKARDSEFTTNERELLHGAAGLYQPWHIMNVVNESFVIAIPLPLSPLCFAFPLSDDRPLIVQFAAHDAQTLADAACVVAPFSDGVDLNCGCPQR